MMYKPPKGQTWGERIKHSQVLFANFDLVLEASNTADDILCLRHIA